MRRSIAATLLACATLAGLPAQRPGDDVIEHIDRWLRAFAAGAIHLGDAKTLPVDGPRRLPSRLLAGRPLTELGALEALLAAAADLDTKPAAERLLRVAALGLVPGTDSHDHLLARGAAQAAIERSDSRQLRALLLDVAQAPATAHADLALRIAALRGLGQTGDQVFWPVLARSLADPEPRVRSAAALAIADLGNPRALDELTLALVSEKDPLALPALVRALASLLDAAQRLGTLDPHTLLRAVEAAAGALGRADARADLDLVRFLDKHRAAPAVPALIGVLERVAPKGPADRLALALRAEAHRVLRSMTGAVLAADEPQQWRAMWERDGQTLPIRAQPRGDDVPGATVAGGFFGIPVLGQRVVFVLDSSGSMQAPAPQAGETYGGEAGVPRRIDVATAECWRSVQELPLDASFNIVVFATDVRAWKDDLVPATPANKVSAKGFLARLLPDGSTNLWGGLSTAVRMRTAQSASRYREPVDELFLLSDGYPSSGEITDGAAIVERIGELNRYARIRIHTVFIGSTESEMDRRLPAGNGGALMQVLAERNEGRFVLR